jgi:hypothetical protein
MATSKETALALAPKGPIDIHLRRLIAQRMGASIQEIADAEKISITTVQNSIKAAEMYREVHSLDFTNMEISKTVTQVLPDTGKAIVRGLRAKKTIKTYRRRNNRLEESFRTVHDIETQLEAVGKVTALAEVVQPKGAKVNVSANASAQASAAAFSDANYQPGVEEKIDRIRQKIEQARTRPRELATIKDDEADIIEGEVEDVSAESGAVLDEEGTQSESTDGISVEPERNT